MGSLLPAIDRPLALCRDLIMFLLILGIPLPSIVLYLKKATMTKDSVHALLTKLHQHWKVGYD